MKISQHLIPLSSDQGSVIILPAHSVNVVDTSSVYVSSFEELRPMTSIGRPICTWAPS